MPVTVSCPSCKSALAVPETFVGKMVRCSGCKDTFTVPAEEAVPVLEAAEEPQGDRLSDRLARREEERRRSRRDEEEDDRPLRSRRDDDEDDDRPRRSRRDEEDAYDRPRRRAASSGNPFENLDDDEDPRGVIQRRPDSEWKWSWNPLIGIMYGPIPIGLLIVGGVALLALIFAAIGSVGRRGF